MADAIRFKQFLCCNTEPNKAIEDNAKGFFSYAGIHDRHFDHTLNETWENLADWTPSVGGVWSVASNQLTGVGNGGADWDSLVSVDDMPSEGILSVTKTGARGGVIFRATNASNHYLFFWDTTSCGFKKKAGGTYSTLVSVPKVYGGTGDIVLCWREKKFRVAADEKWLTMSAWIDGALAVTTVDNIANSTPGKKVGFAVYDTDTVTFGAARIPELTEVIEWASLDVGGSPAHGLATMLGRRHIYYFLRYDGSLRMWRPKASSSDYTYQRHITGFSWDIDSRNLVGHWRQVGAWDDADRLDTALLQRGITRFHKDNNPDLLTREQCYNEAGWSLQRLKEESNRIDLRVPAQVLQEPEDTVTIYFARDGTVIINNLDYIVDLEGGLSLSFRGGQLNSVLRLRKEQ